jgi:hypothetical protein
MTNLRASVATLATDFRLERVVVLAFIASRVVMLLAAVLAESVVPPGRSLEPGDGAPLLSSLTSWDGWFYLGIARDGYHADPIRGPYHDTAFAPLYPVAIRILSVPWPAFVGLVSVVLSNIAFLAALGLLTTLGTIHLERDKAARAAALLAIYPFAFVFGMAYTESLFLLLTVGAFLAAERRHRALAGALFALAVFTRLPGIVLIVPIGVLMARQDGWRPRPSQAWLLLGAAAAAVFVLYIGSVTGSPTGYLDALKDWGKAGLGSAEPDRTVAATLSLEQVALLVTLLGSVFLLVFSRTDRLRLEYVLIPIVIIVVALSSGTLESIGRYTMLAFPYAWILSNRNGWLGRRAWPVISTALLAILATLSFGLYWVP